MPPTCWEVLVTTGFESRRGRISVAVPMAYLAILKSLTGIAGLACSGIKLTDTTYHSLGMQNGHECY